MSQTTVELKPCPFCGGEDLSSGGDDKFVGYYCRTCQAQGPNQYGSHEWNSRALSALHAKAGVSVKDLGDLEVRGPYHYENDLHPCFRIDAPDGLLACVYASDGDTDKAEAIAKHIRSALSTKLQEPVGDAFKRLAAQYEAVSKERDELKATLAHQPVTAGWNEAIDKSVSDEELSGWAEKRADDAGRLARELIQYRALSTQGSVKGDVLDWSNFEGPKINTAWNPDLQDLIYTALTYRDNDFDGDKDEDCGEQIVERLLEALRSATAGVERAVEALEPFAKAADQRQIMCDDTERVTWSAITVGDLRRAASALAALKSEGRNDG